MKKETEYVKGSSTNWTAVFRAAMFLMYSRFGDDLFLTEEYTMTEYPNRIDQIIRKNTNAPVDDVIAGFFRRHNVIEFKSVKDKFDVGSCLRALAYPLLLCDYGCSYVFCGERVHESVYPDDMTLTIIRNARPSRVISFLRRCCARFSMPYAGVYRFENFGCIPVQIVVLNELEDDRCMLLRAVRLGRLPDNAAGLLGESLYRADASASDDDRRRADIVYRFLSKHHGYLFKEGTKLFEIAEAIVADKVKRLVAEAEADGKAEGLLEGKAEGLLEGKAEGLLEGKAEGLLEGISNGIISMAREFGLPDGDIIARLISKLSISEAEARRMLLKFA